MRVPKTAYVAIAAILSSVLLFIIFNTAIVGRLISSAAVDYLAILARQSLQETRAHISTALADVVQQNAATETELLREALRVANANGIVIFPSADRGVYIDAFSGLRAEVLLPGTLPQPPDITPTHNQPLAQQNLAQTLVPFLATQRHRLTDATLMLDIAPTIVQTRLLYMGIHNSERPAFLLYTPETLLSNLTQAIPDTGAAIFVNDTLVAVSNNFQKELQAAAANSRPLPLAALTQHREGRHAITAKTLTSSKATGFSLTMLSREVNIFSMLLRDTRFIIGTTLLFATLVIIIIGYALHMGKMRKAYKRNAPLTPHQVHKFLRQGEGEHVEFKSTLRFNLKSEKHDKNIELAAMKGITAFLNTAGGTLLVGVDDGGNVLGIARDGFRNDDHALRHISNLIAEHIGIRHINAVSLHAVVVQQQTVLVAVCRQATEPAFLQHKDSEYFFVRQGPGNRQLSLSEFWQISRKYH